MFLCAVVVFGCNQQKAQHLNKSKQLRAEEAVKQYVGFDKNPKAFAHTWFTKIKEMDSSGYLIGIVDTAKFKGGDKTFWYTLDSKFHVTATFTN
jgi:hypothetical protein